MFKHHQMKYPIPNLPIFKRTGWTLLFLLLFTGIQQNLFGQTKPIFENGEAQIVPEFKDSTKWIRHDLWVETEFDTDGDGKKDRMHVAVTRPFQTETEGLKLPVVYATSPYYAGTAGNNREFFWDVRHELGEPGPPHVNPEVKRTGERPIISNTEIYI